MASLMETLAARGRQDETTPDTDPAVVAAARQALPGLEDQPVIHDGKIRVMAYGSLAWKHDELDVRAKRPGRLEGFAREVCVHDTVYRGRDQDGQRGLTLGLNKRDGATTEGMVLEIDARDPAAAAAALTAFAKREVPPNMPIYKFAVLPVTLADGSTVPALTCVADPDGPLYVGDSLSRSKKAETIATCAGTRGTNLEYMVNTAATLAERGMPDRDLEQLVAHAVLHRMGLPQDQRESLETLEPPETRERIDRLGRRILSQRPDVSQTVKPQLDPQPDHHQTAPRFSPSRPLAP